MTFGVIQYLLGSKNGSATRAIVAGARGLAGRSGARLRRSADHLGI